MLHGGSLCCALGSIGIGRGSADNLSGHGHARHPGLITGTSSDKGRGYDDGSQDRRLYGQHRSHHSFPGRWFTGV